MPVIKPSKEEQLKQKQLERDRRSFCGYVDMDGKPVPFYDDYQAIPWKSSCEYKYNTESPQFPETLIDEMPKKTKKSIVEAKQIKETKTPEEIKLEQERESRESKIKPFNNILMVGYEIEGAWLKERMLVEDASFSRADFSPDYISVGEFVSKPFDNPHNLFNSIRENWPDAVCHKCALHVHISLKKVGLYSILMEKDFFDFFLQRMESWANSYPYKGEDFWTRWKGKNRYCKMDFFPDLQASFTEKGHNRETRRTILHYCYGQTKTLENRLFPAFKEAKTAVSATKAFINCVEDYLETHKLEEKNIVYNVSEPETEQQPVNAKKKFNYLTDFNSEINKDFKFNTDNELLKYMLKKEVDRKKNLLRQKEMEKQVEAQKQAFEIQAEKMREAGVVGGVYNPYKTVKPFRGAFLRTRPMMPESLQESMEQMGTVGLATENQISPQANQVSGVNMDLLVNDDVLVNKSSPRRKSFTEILSEDDFFEPVF